MIVERVKNEISSGDTIPKPNPKGKFLVKGWGRRRDQSALIYTIPNHKNPAKPYQKGICESEFEAAYHELKSSGKFSRQWFNSYLSACAKEGACNFTTIGGVFEMLGEAWYAGNGVYQIAR